MPIDITLEKRCAKYSWSCINSSNCIVNSTAFSAITSYYSEVTIYQLYYLCFLHCMDHHVIKLLIMILLLFDTTGVK